MRFHWQNLNEKPYKRTGSILRHGRAWLDFRKFGWHWEWTAFKLSAPGVQFDLADYDEDAIGGHASLGFLAFY
jgi:hypothetical protein